MGLDCDRIVSRELLPDEKLAWCGQPSLKKIFDKSDAFLVPFSAVWGGIVIFMFTMVAININAIGPIFIFPLLILTAFLVLGLYLMFGRFLVKRANKKNTYYAITNLRVFAVKTDRNGNKRNFASAQLSALRTESIDTDKNGFGSIVVGAVASWYTGFPNSFSYSSGRYQPDILSFHDIEDCEKVFQIYKAQKYQQ